MKKLMFTGHRIISSNKGFSLVEVVVAVLLLAIAIVPILGAFGPAIFATGAEEGTAVFINQTRGTLSRVLALDFATLDSNQGDPVNLATLFGTQAEADKETFSFKGASYTPTVAITDASGGAGGLLELTVTLDLDYVSLKTLKGEY